MILLAAAAEWALMGYIQVTVGRYTIATVAAIPGLASNQRNLTKNNNKLTLNSPSHLTPPLSFFPAPTLIISSHYDAADEAHQPNKSFTKEPATWR